MLKQAINGNKAILNFKQKKKIERKILQKTTGLQNFRYKLFEDNVKVFLEFYFECIILNAIDWSSLLFGIIRVYSYKYTFFICPWYVTDCCQWEEIGQRTSRNFSQVSTWTAKNVYLLPSQLPHRRQIFRNVVRLSNECAGWSQRSSDSPGKLTLSNNLFFFARNLYLFFINVRLSLIEFIMSPNLKKKLVYIIKRTSVKFLLSFHCWWNGRY